MILVLRCHITKLFVDWWAGRARHCHCLAEFRDCNLDLADRYKRKLRVS